MLIFCPLCSVGLKYHAPAGTVPAKKKKKAFKVHALQI
jgi:hypothetical protein